MKFSISIPVCHQAHFVSSALESLSVQARDVQVAILDATPDDSVQAVLKPYSELFAYHRHGQDAGQAAAIQEGWDNTDGEILAWLCADDYFFPDTIESVRNIFTAHPEVDVVYGDSVFVNEAGHFLGYFPSIDENPSSLLKGCTISQPACFVRRTAVDSIGKLNQDLHYIMDWDLWTRLYLKGFKFYYLKKPLAVVRMHRGTKTSSRSQRRFFEIALHLWRNTSFYNTFRSLTGFYCQDLLTAPVKGFEFFLSKLFSVYHKRKLKRQTLRGVPRRSNYGFYSYYNEVEAEVDVFMPWFHKCPPSAVELSCDLKTPPEAELNGLRLISRQASPYIYEIPALDCSSHLLHLRLSSSAGEIWHLQFIEFR